MVYQTEGNGVRPALILSLLSSLPSRETQEKGIRRKEKTENGDNKVEVDENGPDRQR